MSYGEMNDELLAASMKLDALRKTRAELRARYSAESNEIARQIQIVRMYAYRLKRKLKATS
jgi:hypothetical protein